MITKEMINRINELSRKQRSVGLSEAEKKEQQELRGQYLAAIRAQVKAQLDAIEIVEPDDPRLKHQHHDHHHCNNGHGHKH